MNILNYCKRYPKQAFDTGECILSEGTKTGVIYILVDGVVEVVKDGIKLARVSEPGSIFGEISALLNTPHMANVIATEATRCYVVEDAPAFIRSNADVGLLMATVLAQRLSTVTHSLTTVKRSVDSLIKQQTSRKGAPKGAQRETPYIGVVSVGTFHKGSVIRT